MEPLAYGTTLFQRPGRASIISDPSCLGVDLQARLLSPSKHPKPAQPPRIAMELLLSARSPYLSTNRVTLQIVVSLQYRDGTRCSNSKPKEAAPRPLAPNGLSGRVSSESGDGSIIGGHKALPLIGLRAMTRLDPSARLSVRFDPVLMYVYCTLKPVPSQL